MISILIETHRWRGLSWGRLPAAAWVVAGWLTVGVVCGSVLGRLREMGQILETIKDGDDV